MSLYKEGDTETLPEITLQRVALSPLPSLGSLPAQSSGSLLNPHLKSGFPWVFLSASESLLPECPGLGSSIFDFSPRYGPGTSALGSSASP